MFISRSREALQRALERRQHADSALRLTHGVPGLSTLKLEVEDARGSAFGFVEHVRHVVVASAPALFEIPCGDRTCRDGGHDFTGEILSALRDGQRRMEGEHVCDGSVGTDGALGCGRLLRYVGTGSYREAKGASLDVATAH